MSAATFEAPKMECFDASTDIVSLISFWKGWPGSISHLSHALSRGASLEFAIHFVGGHEYEHSRGTQLAGGLEENKCPISVDAEVGVRVARRPVVRRLRGGVDHESNIAAIFPEYSFDFGAVANIGIEMPVAISP